MPTIRPGSSKKIKEYLPSSVKLPDADLKEVIHDLEALQTGAISRLPLRCTGPECRYAKDCPLQKKNVAPIGEACPIEQLLINTWVTEFISTLNIDSEDSIELSMLYDLVEAELLDMRTSQDLAIKDYIEEQAVGVDSQGRIVYRKEKAIALEVKEIAKKMKSNIRQQFLATREMKAKYRKEDDVDPSTFASTLVQEFEKKYGTRKDEIVDAEVLGDQEVPKLSSPEEENGPSGELPEGSETEGTTTPSEDPRT
jgi:hypothetical protein